MKAKQCHARRSRAAQRMDIKEYRMKRRIFSILLAVLLLIPWTFASAATAPVVITSEDVRGKVGDTVAVTLNVVVEPPKLNQTMDSLQFVLEYDSAALEFDGIQEISGDKINILGAQFICSVTTKPGAVTFSAAATNGASGSGTLMHVRFRILSAVSTMLVLKKVSYSFVTNGSGSQRGYTGGTLNLGRITGESVPTTIVPASYSPYDSPQPSTPVASDSAEPRFPVTEVSPVPGTSPEPEENSGDSDALAYIVFVLFIVVAILVCVVLTLMIVRRGRKARAEALLGDDEEDIDISYEEDEYGEDAYGDEPYEDEPYTTKKKKSGVHKKDKAVRYEDGEDEDDEPPIQVVRRTKKK